MREPTPLGDLLRGVLKDLGVASPENAIALLERWHQLAPPPWAERAVPVSLRSGVLEVAVADGTTASLLRYQASQLVEELGARLGAGLVTTVTIRVDRHRKRS